MNLGFVIGCSQYDDPDINSLKYTALDAADIATVLAKRCGLNEDEIVALTSTSPGNRQATRANIIRELTSVKARVRNSKSNLDKLFLFFSGHGFHSTINGSDYALPQDAVAASLEDTSISMESLAKYLTVLNARTTILLFDLCRAVVSAGKGGSELTPIQSNALTFKGTATFWSCSPGEKSYEADGLERGVFTYALVEAFGDAGKCKTVYELDEFLVASVPQICRQQELPIQIPYSRVEPLKIKDSVLITPELFSEWQQLVPLGEQRVNVTRSATFALGDTNNICAVDFGTSYSAIATVDATGEVVFIPSGEGKALVPSVVSILPNLEYIVGWRAIEYGRTKPGSTFFNMKRFLGSSTMFSVEGRTFSPEFLASLILRSLKTNAEEFLGQPLSQVIISAPANFSMAQCNALVESFKLAGFLVSRLVGEPSAAALIAARRLIPALNVDSIVYVIDLGGGTFDVSVLEVGEGIWEIKSAGGDRALGGADYDDAVVKYINSIVRSESGFAGLEFSEADAGQMRFEAERAKIALSAREETLVIIQNIESPTRGIINLEIPITRNLFRALTEELDRRVERCILDALARSGVRKKTIDLVLSAGQGAKIFTVRETIERLFPGIPIESKFQENAVSLGLAKYTGVLKGVIRGELLLDALPTTVGVKCKSHDDATLTIATNPFDNVIPFAFLPRDTTIPTQKTEMCVLSESYQGEVHLTFVEISGVGAVIPVAEEVLFLPHEFKMTFDVDANRTIFVHLNHRHSGERIRSIQLNNFFRPLKKAAAGG